MEEHYEIVQFSIKYRNYSRIAFVLRNLKRFTSRKLSRATRNILVLILRFHWQIIIWLYVLIGRRDYFNASFYDSKLKTALLHRSLIFFFQHHTDNNEAKKCVDA